MSWVLTIAESKKLEEQSILKQYYTNEYLYNKKDVNYCFLKKKFQINDDKMKVYNVWSGLFTSIVDTYSSAIWNPKTSLWISMQEFAKDLLAIWRCVFWLKKINDKWDIYRIPAEDYIYSSWHKVVTHYEAIEWQDKNYYTLIQEYWAGFIESKLYKNLYTSATNNNLWKQVPLDSIPQTANLEEIMKTWLSVPSIFIVNDNTYNNGDPISILEKVRNIVYSIDRKNMIFDTEFAREVEPYKIFDNINLWAFVDTDVNSNGYWQIDFSHVWKLLSNEPWQSWNVRFVSNDNPLIEKAMDYEKTQIQKLSSMTKIPLDFLGYPDSSALSWVSRTLLFESFIRQVERYRNIIQEWLMEIIAVIEWWVLTNGDIVDSMIIWEDVISKTWLETLEELELAQKLWLISTETARSRYFKKMSAEDLQEEAEKIENENNLNSNNSDDGN